MNFAENGLVYKIESVVSTVCGLVWSALRLSNSLKSPENDCGERYLCLGFKALIATTEKETLHIVHSHTRALSSSSSQSYSSNSFRLSYSSSSFSSSVTGDLIGTESGVYMMSSNSNGEDLMTEMVDINGAPCNCSTRKKPRCIDTRRREYLEPISILGRPGNFSGDKPFALKRRCVDGRLIITMETHKKCHRRVTENGRLSLYLVPPVEDDEYGGKMEDVVEENDVQDDICDNGSSDIGKAPCEAEVEKGPFAMLASSMPEACVMNKNWNWISVNGGAGRRCFTYAGQGISATNFFNMPTMNKPIYT